MVVIGMVGAMAATLVVTGVMRPTATALVVVDIVVGAIIGTILSKRCGRTGDRCDSLNDRDGCGQCDGCSQCCEKPLLHIDNPPIRFDRREIATSPLTNG
jgi:hypothetical protein